ncbi:MAG: biotin-dependent carboxyltransferase family protein [Planctomycetaceae bacterium]
MSLIRVIRAGLTTTIQDLGRPGFRQFGVPSGGAMDRFSHELANRLVGNTPSAATLEMMLSGDELEFTGRTRIAITGGNFSPVTTTLAQREPIAIPQNTPVTVPAKTRIRFQTAQLGCRCYLAVAGGFDVPEVMGSRATLMRAQLGGLQGRALKNGDELPLGHSTNSAEVMGDASETTVISFPSWFVRPMDLPSSDSVTVRVVRGEHFAMLTAESQLRFWSENFQLTPQSDRMGYRLSATPLVLEDTSDMMSEGTAVGTIQLPPDGRPILLMADSAPTGGYRRIAHVISADLPLAAQTRPGQSLRFVETAIEEARALFQKRRADLDRAITMMRMMPVAKPPEQSHSESGSRS